MQTVSRIADTLEVPFYLMDPLITPTQAHGRKSTVNRSAVRRVLEVLITVEKKSRGFLASFSVFEANVRIGPYRGGFVWAGVLERWSSEAVSARAYEAARAWIDKQERFENARIYIRRPWLGQRNRSKVRSQNVRRAA
jgi:hypothetical protein